MRILARRPSPGADTTRTRGREKHGRHPVRTGLGAALAVLAVAASVFGLVGPAAAAQGTSRLSAGEQLGANQRLVSPDGRYSLVMQANGNLLEYGPDNETIWATGTQVAGSVAAMRWNGQLVVTTPWNQVIWATGTDGNFGAELELQNDTTLVVYGAGHVAKWTSRTTASDAKESGTRPPAPNSGSAATTGRSSAGTGRSSATTSTSEAAISWFMRHLGENTYEGMCEQAVENAHGLNGVYPSARANWSERSQYAPYYKAPRGALVFYNTSGNKHVAISLGDGRVVSTSVNHKIGIAPIGYFQNPLGWAPNPWS